MSTPLLDLSYLFEISGGEPVYIFEVLSLFLDTVPPNIYTLERTVLDTDDYESIHRQAHSLKSSAGIIKIREMYDDINRIDMLSREKTGKAEIIARMENVVRNFNKAIPLIEAERGRNKPAA